MDNNSDLEAISESRESNPGLQRRAPSSQGSRKMCPGSRAFLYSPTLSKEPNDWYFKEEGIVAYECFPHICFQSECDKISPEELRLVDYRDTNCPSSRGTTYKPTVLEDPNNKISGNLVFDSFQHICFQYEYVKFSPEEIRLVDYREMNIFVSDFTAKKLVVWDVAVKDVAVKDVAVKDVAVKDVAAIGVPAREVPDKDENKDENPWKHGTLQLLEQPEEPCVRLPVMTATTINLASFSKLQDELEHTRGELRRFEARFETEKLKLEEIAQHRIESVSDDMEGSGSCSMAQMQSKMEMKLSESRDQARIEAQKRLSGTQPLELMESNSIISRKMKEKFNMLKREQISALSGAEIAALLSDTQVREILLSNPTTKSILAFDLKNKLDQEVEMIKKKYNTQRKDRQDVTIGATTAIEQETAALSTEKKFPTSFNMVEVRLKLVLARLEVVQESLQSRLWQSVEEAGDCGRNVKPPQQPPRQDRVKVPASMLICLKPPSLEYLKQLLGETIVPLIQAKQPALASKVTSMLVDFENSDFITLVEKNTNLLANVDEALTVYTEKPMTWGGDGDVATTISKSISSSRGFAPSTTASSPYFGVPGLSGVILKNIPGFSKWRNSSSRKREREDEVDEDEEERHHCQHKTHNQSLASRQRD